MLTESLDWFVTCPKGLEPLLADEMSGLGAMTVTPAIAGCHMQAGLAVGYRACLWSRLANRVLLTLGEAVVTQGVLWNQPLPKFHCVRGAAWRREHLCAAPPCA